MKGQHHARAAPRWQLDAEPQDWVRRIQAEELSRAPAPGRLRAADVIEVTTP